MNAIISSISLALLTYLVFFAYQSYRVDKLRQDLFSLRDDLFDEALDGHIAFDDKGYQVTRQLINGLVRFAHELTIVQYLCFSVFFRSKKYSSLPSIQSLLKTATPAEQEIFRKYSDKIHIRVIQHLAFSPLFVATMFIPFVLMISFKLGFNLFEKISKITKTPFSSLERVAYSHGS